MTSSPRDGHQRAKFRGFIRRSLLIKKNSITWRLRVFVHLSVCLSVRLWPRMSDCIVRRIFLVFLYKNFLASMSFVNLRSLKTLHEFEPVLNTFLARFGGNLAQKNWT